ncbi:MAG TPA: hypothetical protein VJQ78_01170 [Sphingobium sp.]|nr:hypothetical protein [Sphingobium sp.]
MGPIVAQLAVSKTTLGATSAMNAHCIQRRLLVQRLDDPDSHGKPIAACSAIGGDRIVFRHCCAGAGGPIIVVAGNRDRFTDAKIVHECQAILHFSRDRACAALLPVVDQPVRVTGRSNMLIDIEYLEFMRHDDTSARSWPAGTWNIDPRDQHRGRIDFTRIVG